MPQSLLRTRDGHGATVTFTELLFVLMLLGLFASSAMPQAFGERGWMFALCYVALQVGRV